MTTENQLVPIQSAFSNKDTFQEAQRMAKLLISSDLVPANFRGEANLGNAVIALEMAQRIGASPLAVMQSLYIVHGRPTWSSQFIIAALNASRRFSPLRFELTGEKDSRACLAWALELSTGDRLEGPEVTMAMAKAEGWIDKNGSKWKTMPELMLRYRAATFFGRLYAPDILNGMQTQEEVHDIGIVNVTPKEPIKESFVDVKPIEEKVEVKVETPKPKPEPKPSKANTTELVLESAPPSACEKLRIMCGEYGMLQADMVKLMSAKGKAPKSAKTFDELTEENQAWLEANMNNLVEGKC